MYLEVTEATYLEELKENSGSFVIRKVNQKSYNEIMRNVERANRSYMLELGSLDIIVCGK